MKSKLIVFGILMAGLVVACGPAFAHHGSGLSYKMDQEITVKGTVTNFRWANPHAQLYFDETAKDGSLVHWAAEMNSPGVLIRDGWSKTTVKPGDVITVTMHPSKSGDPVGLCGLIVLPDGRQIMGYTGTQKDAPAGTDKLQPLPNGKT
jgi:hypothetical protein